MTRKTVLSGSGRGRWRRASNGTSPAAYFIAIPQYAQKHEVERRLKLLGTCAKDDCTDRQLRDRSYETFVAPHHLAAWKHNYHLHGLDGLLPSDWTLLDKQTQCTVRTRLRQLGTLADKERITSDDIRKLAARRGWSYSTAERWIRRYRAGGLWALASHADPEKQRKRGNQKHPPPDLGSFEPEELDKALDEVMKYWPLIEPFVHQLHSSNEDIEKHAKKHGVSPRTVRRLLSLYKTYGPSGLVPKTRSDKGSYHNLSDRMVHLIKGIRFSKYDMTLSELHDKACEKARLLGEPEPSMWQVRTVHRAIDEQVLTVADGRLGDYRNKFRTTYRFRFDGTIIIYQIDWTIVPVLIKDLRRTGVRRKGGETRAYMTLCVEASSGIPTAAIFTYDTPNRFTIGSVIHDALQITAKKPYGGIPDEIWVDQGKQMISEHMKQVARDLHITLHPCIPHDREDRGNPQENGKVERLHRTLQTEFWAKMSGYVGSNTVERNPNAQAELTIYEVVEKFWEFINNTYLQEKHGDEKTTPKEYWAEHCHTWPPDDERELDILLQEAEWKKLHKEGIKHDSRVYWSEDFGSVIPTETKVLIRSHPRYTRPDEILVFYEDQRIRAVARDSEEGRAVTGEQIAIAQRRQKAAIRREIEEGRAAVRKADREIEKQKKQTASKATPSASSNSQTPASTQHQARPKPSERVKLPADPWERLLYMKQQKEQKQPGGH